MQPLERPPSIEIMEANVIEDQTGSTLVMCADDEGQILRMEVRVLDNDYQRNLRGQSALHYLLGELGMMHIDRPEDLVSKRLHRWAWEKVASIATPKTTPADVQPIQISPRSDKPSDGRFVYVISCEGSDPPLCKIGIAGSPEKRVRQLSTSSPHHLRLEMARYSDRARAVEAAAHSHFSHARRNGEWFEVCATEAISFVNCEITQMRKAA